MQHSHANINAPPPTLKKDLGKVYSVGKMIKQATGSFLQLVTLFQCALENIFLAVQGHETTTKVFSICL